MSSSFDEFSEFDIEDAIDHAIIMHRDAHFNGSFNQMIEYYEKGGKGAMGDLNLERILHLKNIEESNKQNLSQILSSHEHEKIETAKKTYKKLKSLQGKSGKTHSSLIADLILSEEEIPEKEINAIVEKKGAIVPDLIQILKSEEYHDSIFPGYGLAPALATRCLGLIGDDRATIALFETIGDSDFFNEDLALDALFAIGEPAKRFLLKVLHGKPLTYDNERAAIALGRFKNDPEVAEFCFEILKDIDFKNHLFLATHLILNCEGLKDPKKQKEFIEFVDNPKVPSMLSQDLKLIINSFKKPTN